MIGVSPYGLTLRQLWRMACGKLWQDRFDRFEMVCLIFGMEKLDLEAYLYHGKMIDTGRGGPVKLTGETKRRVEAEMERILKEDPTLSKPETFR